MSSPPHDTPQPSPESVRKAVEVVVASAGFCNSERMVRFLRFVVQKTLSGAGGDIKEYTLGTEVFDRPSDFDPKIDTIVRVEARRLRRKLGEYYEGPGKGDAVRIDVPSPGYAPVFVEIPTTRPAPLIADPKPRARRRTFGTKPWIWVVAAVLVAAAWGLGSRNAKETQLTSVAVLPFANMSGDAAQEYFSDGFTEELIDRLTAIDGLRVAARTSAFEFKNKAQDIRQIAARLNVDAIVEGSVRRAGDTVRITAQLIRTGDGYHVWSKSWDRQGKDVLAIETDVATAVAESFRQTLRAERGNRGATSLEAHDLYLLGRHHWNTLEPPEIFKAIDYYQQAIARDPNYALAYSGLSEAYSYLIDLDAVPTREMAAKARAAAEKAIALDDTLAEAHTALGLMLMDAEWDMPGAEREFQRALELKPRFAYGIHWYGHFLENRGHFAEGCGEMKRAIALDPLAMMYNLDLAMCFYKQRHYGEALAQTKRTRELGQDSPFLDVADALFALAAGDSAQALSAARKADAGLGSIPSSLSILAQAQGAAANLEGARLQLAKMKQAAAKGYVPAYAMAVAGYAAGDPEEGLRWLKRAVADRNGALLWLGNTPMFDDARRDARAAAVLQQVGGGR